MIKAFVICISTTLSFSVFALDCAQLCPNGLTKVTQDEIRSLKGTFVKTGETSDGAQGYIQPVDCSVAGNCPDLSCREFAFVTYMKVENANLTGSKFGHFGYGESVTGITNSDLRCTTFNSLAPADFRGSIANQGSHFGHFGNDIEFIQNSGMQYDNQ